MGGGALIQLAAYGSQNIYLTGDPQITFWKTVYKRYTNFSVESIQQNISGNLLAGKPVSVTISRDGDLLKNLWIQYNPQTIYNGGEVTFSNGGIPSNLGNTILKQMELEIGGNLIDRQYGVWLTIWGNLTNVNYISPSPPVDTFLQQGCTGVEPSVSTLSDRMSYNHQQQNTKFDFNLVTDCTYNTDVPETDDPCNICLKYYLYTNTVIPSVGTFDVTVWNVNQLYTFSNYGTDYQWFYITSTFTTDTFICSYTSVTTSGSLTTFTGCTPIYSPVSNISLVVSNNTYIVPAFKITGNSLPLPPVLPNVNQITAGNKNFNLQFFTYYTGISSKSSYRIYTDGITNNAQTGYLVYNASYTSREIFFEDVLSPPDVSLYIFNLNTSFTNVLDNVPGASVSLTQNDFVVFNNLPNINKPINLLTSSSLPCTIVTTSQLNLNFSETVLPPTGTLITTYNDVTYYLTYDGLNYEYIYVVGAALKTYIFNIYDIRKIPSGPIDVTIPIGTNVYFSYYNYTLSNAPTEAYIPMQFWFCKNPGLALPLIALQYSEVKLNIQLADYKELHATQFSDVNLSSIRVFADFVYLDTTERRLFAQNAHEYLIEQLQYNVFNNSFASNVSGGQLQIKLNFANPVKEIIFCGSPNATGIESGGIATPTNILTNNTVSLSNVQLALIFNQVNRFSSRNLKYFTRNQLWDCHSGSGSANSSNNYDLNDNIGIYSFSMRPEEFQPSGSCNFSRITNPYMVFSNFDSTINEELNYLNIYATNYNILRIMSGMGNLAFAY